MSDTVEVAPLEEKKLRWHIDQIVHSPENSVMRKIPEAKKESLKKSIQEEGQLMPLLLDIRGDHRGEALGGNNTLDVLKELHAEFPDEQKYQWIWVELRTPKNDAHAFELALKHNAQYAEYVQPGLVSLIEKYKPEINVKEIEVNVGQSVNLSTFLDQYKADVRVNSEPAAPAQNDVTQYVNLAFNKDVYEKYFPKITAIQEEHELNSKTDVFIFLLDYYERTKSTSEPTE